MNTGAIATIARFIICLFAKNPKTNIYFTIQLAKCKLFSCFLEDIFLPFPVEASNAG